MALRSVRFRFHGGCCLGKVVDIECCLSDGDAGNTGASYSDDRAGGLQRISFYSCMFRIEKAVIVIPREMICKIGDDVILVDVEVG